MQSEPPFAAGVCTTRARLTADTHRTSRTSLIPFSAPANMASSRTHLGLAAAAAAAALVLVLLAQLPGGADAQAVPGFPAGYCWIPSLECELFSGSRSS